MHFSRVSFISFLTLVLNPSSQACLLTSSLVTLATALPSPATGVLRYSYQPFKHPPFKCSKGRSTRKSRLKIPQTGLGVSIQGERDENFDFHLNRIFQEWSWLQCKGRPGAWGVPGQPQHDRHPQVQDPPGHLPCQPWVASPGWMLGWGTATSSLSRLPKTSH